jgi:DNA primase
LWEAAGKYKASLAGSPAAEYLETRGLLVPEVNQFALGYVADPLPGHEMYKGMLSIPYLRQAQGERWSVVSMRFRCVTPDCEHSNHPKYRSEAGDTPRIYNTNALIRSDDRIAICEGEIDAITATIAGIPAIGIAGVESWKAHFKEPFLGYEVVYILADGDEPGMKFASRLANSLPNAKILPSKPGEDVNSTFLKFGAEALTERMKV